MRLHTYTRTYIHTYIHAYIHADINVHIHLHTYTLERKHIRIYMHIYRHIHYDTRIHFLKRVNWSRTSENDMICTISTMQKCCMRASITSQLNLEPCDCRDREREREGKGLYVINTKRACLISMNQLHTWTSEWRCMRAARAHTHTCYLWYPVLGDLLIIIPGTWFNTHVKVRITNQWPALNISQGFTARSLNDFLVEGSSFHFQLRKNQNQKFKIRPRVFR